MDFLSYFRFLSHRISSFSIFRYFGSERGASGTASMSSESFSSTPQAISVIKGKRLFSSPVWPSTKLTAPNEVPNHGLLSIEQRSPLMMKSGASYFRKTTSGLVVSLLSAGSRRSSFRTTPGIIAFRRLSKNSLACSGFQRENAPR